ncbi:D-Ala-D-Ala carboxypeptidase family metallohydrolase [Salinicola halophilus]|uniref:D-Ala-D-Ala carboxypeptidase family metallohydrolase n=1 Tax=Salinicola halophilus TaxID=184065 RepID=UPI000DA1AEEC|nr:D-Ala-D-Ala carboxypeptidase family metallohydrolase [Salinicola halophilus]
MDTTRVSPNFLRSEFACQCGCGFDTVDVSTIEVVQAVRDHFGVPVTINSGCRCPEHNRAVGGAEHSQHVLARAADIAVRGVSPDTVHDWIAEQYPSASLGRYRTFTHVDTRTGGPARWDNR